MYQVIPGFLDEPQLETLRAQLTPMNWEDGTLTAGNARNRKHNRQLTHLSREAVPLLQQAARNVMSHPGVQQWAEPRRIARILFSRYDEGMFYRSHNDAAVLRVQGPPARADISFTLLLSEPADYTGGELVLETVAGDLAIKEPAGTLVLYDTGLRHRVETVESGCRLVTVGWVESLIRAPEAREVLRDLNPLIKAAMTRDPDGDEVISLRRVRASLMRIWAET